MIEGSFEALKTLYVLWSLGIVEKTAAPASGDKSEKKVKKEQEEVITVDDVLHPLAEEEESFLRRVDAVYSRLDSMGLHGLLGVDQEADGEVIKKNFYRLAREFHPDRHFTSGDPSAKKKLTAIYDAVTEAYNTLREEKKRKNYFRSLRISGKTENAGGARAEAEFRIGVNEFKKRNFSRAVDHFKRATGIMPERASYWSHLSLAYSKMPDKMKEAEEALMTAIKVEPLNPDYYANLGLIYMKAGRTKKARGSFEEALRIDAGNEKAIKGLRQTTK
jgi:curved DNA-binding protein CbpA